MAEASRNNTGVSSSVPVSAFESFVSKHFVRLLVGIAVGGGALAFLVPWLLYIAGITGEADTNLRLHILYVTGGIIAVLGLVETRHKNTTDRAKALSEQARQFNETIAKEREKIEADKAKNEQNHIRQVHAERRSRYTTAIEQLSNRENATTRLGGVYALIGLIDEWLTDGALLTDKERRKEGQVIINSLCAYIRSPFPLAERAEQIDGEYTKDLQNDFRGDTEKFDADKRAFTRDKAALEEERQIRQNIIKEMREHLLDAEESGTWSAFDYSFSNAYFFYPVDFSDSHFCASLDFAQATFTEKADFFMSAFAGEADFSKAAFIQDADFYGVKFTKRTDFCKASFDGEADFFDGAFLQGADFSEVKFTGDANFSRANFTEGTDFFKATFTGDGTFYKAKFNGPLLFSRALFMRNATFSKARFGKEANFFMTVFTKEADFSGSKFSGHASFFEVKFSSGANFFKTKFAENTRFSGAQFNGPTNFSITIFHSKPEFANTPNKNYKAKFSHKAAPADYSFKTAAKSTYKIETREQEHNGVKFIIPEDAMLFDPDNPVAWAEL
ncbi:pentapeptide repeat-containing protein [Rothia aeria]|uniref:pentapeptide repeat-containing protein n=1 Tax=Rothia aeria TaxID=172042 RepID=UPI00288B08DE|nr:pentapeptide repeat-containing protein [Rothia aeria]